MCRMRGELLKIYVLGDSHVVAIERALKARRAARGLSDREERMFVSRFARIKNGVALEGVTLEDIATMLQADSDAIVVSMVGGNQSNMFGMMRHSVAFDFFEPSLPDLPAAESAQLIPVAMIEQKFHDAVDRREGHHLRALRCAFTGPIVHVLPPPPKKDNEFIRTKAETFFLERDIASIGVSPAPLRLKLWALQARITEALCAELDVDVLPPPAEAVTEKGFLAKEYYGRDATHANGRYGESVLEQIFEVASRHEAALS